MKKTEGKRIIAIVQARLGSSRLPGKVLHEILPGRSLLALMLERLKQSQLITELVVATTTSTIDDKIAQACAADSISIFRGQEEDVLGRYVAAAQAATANIIVRLCADSPLHDAEIIDRCIETYLRNQNQVDFVCNVMPNTFPYGTSVEVFPLDVLHRINRLTLDPAMREHVTQYVHQNPNYFHVVNVENDQDLSHHRWAVDYQHDFDFVVSIYKELYNPAKIFSWRDVISLSKVQVKQ